MPPSAAAPDSPRAASPADASTAPNSRTQGRRILVLNGPNLNLLGTREPEIYGTATLADVERLCAERAAAHDLGVEFHQSNHEGELIDRIQAAATDPDVMGCVLNAGALTHTSVGLHDALKGTGLPTVEVHISNPHAREPFRHTSYLSSVCLAVVAGLGIEGYGYAVTHLARRATVDAR